jgi:hypothetical protein
MSQSEVHGIDLFKIAGHSISGWLPSYKTADAHSVRQPFCSLMEERLLLYLEYHPLVARYGRADISPQFAQAYKMVLPTDCPLTISYLFEGKEHSYLPDVVGTLTDGRMLIAEAGMEEDKQSRRNRAKAEAARQFSHLHAGGVYWIGTEQSLPLQRHYNLVFLHARRQEFPAFAALAQRLQELWPWGEMTCVDDLVVRLGERWSPTEREAAVWKICAEAAAQGRLLVDLTSVLLNRTLPLILLPPDASPLLPDALPELLPDLDTTSLPLAEEPEPVHNPYGSTFDATTLSPQQQQRFHRNLIAVQQVLAGASLSETAQRSEMAPSTLSRLVKRVEQFGEKACVPYGTYSRQSSLHPAFQEGIRLLYCRPLKLSIAAIHEHVELRRVAKRLREVTGQDIPLPSYDQVRDYVRKLARQPEIEAARLGQPTPVRARQSPRSFALSVPAPAQLVQVDEHTMEIYVITPDGIPVAQRIHAAVLVCVKTAAIMSAVLALGPLKEEDYMRLLKGALEPKDRLVIQANCAHYWPCFGKPAIVFHDRGKIFTSERARQVLVDRLGIVTEQAPPYCPSAKGTVEALFRWMTQRFERRLPNTSHGIHNAKSAAETGGMTFDELECYFLRAIVDDYQQAWDPLRRQIRATLWEEAVRKPGVPHYLGSPADLKLLLMKAVNRKSPSQRYGVHDGARLSFQGRWYVCPGLLDRLRDKEFDIYYDRRDVSVIYLFLEGSYLGEAYCAQFMGHRVSLWEAQAERMHDGIQAKAAQARGQETRARLQEDVEMGKKERQHATCRKEKARQLDRQRSEIHPLHVLETLQAMDPPSADLLSLPEAEPDPEWERPIQKVSLREQGEEPPP